MDFLAIISLFVGTIGLTYGVGSAVRIGKLVAHLKDQGVIDKDYSLRS